MTALERLRRKLGGPIAPWWSVSLSQDEARALIEDFERRDVKIERLLIAANNAAALLRGMREDVARHTDVSPEVDAVDEAVAALQAKEEA